MIRRYTAIIAFAFFCLGVQAQSSQELLSKVENNNLSLKALQQQIEADSQSNLASAALTDPSVEFGYLFGLEGMNKHTLSVRQSFDFGAISGARKTAALTRNELLTLEYRAARRDVLTRARTLLAEIIYYNALIEEYSIRLDYARQVEQAYRTGCEQGEFSILDLRKASVSLAEAEGLLELAQVERYALVSELAALNGGEEIEVLAKSQEKVMIPGNFEDWVQSADGSSVLQYVSKQVSLSEQQLKLTRNETMPNITIGYMEEVMPVEAFRGPTIGVSIPLWSSSHKVSSAKAQVQAAKAQQKSVYAEFYAQAKALYNKALRLGETSAKYNALTAPEESLRDLKTALDAGEISLIDYIAELSFYYDTRELALRTERDYLIAVAELKALEM